MVLGIYLAVSALAALVVCVGAGGFASLRWLWLLPVSFAGVFLSLLVLTFLLVLVMSLAVDMKKRQERDSAFYRFVIMALISLLVPLLGIHIHEEGLEKAPKDGRFLLVCNHLHEIDPAVLLRAFPKSTLAFISKREVDEMFLVGPFLHKILGQAVNRENDREALKTILSCIDLIKEDKASVAVFPEGYIKPDRLLRPFRNGVFKIAQRTNVPVVVCTLRNTQYAIKNVLKLKRSDIYLHLVDVIYPEQMQGMTTVDLGKKVYTMMVEDLGPELVWQGEN